MRIRLALAAATAASLMVAAASAIAATQATPAPSAAMEKRAAPAAIAPDGEADRLPPPQVMPVVRAGVRYAQAADGRAVGATQSRGVLVASDAATGKPLWTLVVYPNPIDPALEEDVQWVFFQSMAFDPDGRLRIRDESGRSWLVDVRRRESARAP